MVNDKTANLQKLKKVLIFAITVIVVFIVGMLALKKHNAGTYRSNQAPTEENGDFELDSFLGRAVRFGFESEYNEEYISTDIKKYAVKTSDEFNSAYLAVNTDEAEITSYTLNIHLYKTELKKELNNIEYDNNQMYIKLNSEAMSDFCKWNDALLRAFDKEAMLSDAQLNFAAQFLLNTYEEKQTQTEIVGEFELYAVYEEFADYDVLSFSASKYTMI
ncbi:MAG: hypothetical protein IJF80_00695 [Clostridia bacterium]|nr:hypothetical protein [Clostridia bacterium]